ncbi:MAG: amidohydrolase family protein [Rhizobiales bacterium]|nr:amidohydrolase family protein [Hyphomicrobiales bacterium]
MLVTIGLPAFAGDDGREANSVTINLHAIDCDVHPTVPGMKALLPYLDDYWRDSVEERGIGSLESISYPPNSPLTARDEWRGTGGLAGTDVTQLSETVFGRFGSSLAICNCLYGVQLVFAEDMARAFTRALNDWIVKEWLDKDARLRASIVVPLQNIEYAVDEIERCASDRRFVQVLVLAMEEAPLGRRSNWPVYAAAERHGLPLGVHAGSAYRHPVTSLGWPSYYIEDYAAQAQGFQSQLTSLIAEGVFAKFPSLKVVLMESGVTWLPGFLWRFSKFWRGLRTEVPWVDRPPDEIVRDHVRLTVQPFDVPEDSEAAERAIEHLRSDDILLFASDYPHWQFDGDEAMPKAIPRALYRKILVDNPLATYPRLKEAVR